MRPLLRPELVNGPFGDAGLFVDFMFARRAMLFDLGDIGPLGPRKLLRVDRVFVSHAHMDHFAGFDRLLRIVLGRGKRITLYGPPGFIDRVDHKIQGYTWNLAKSYAGNLVLDVVEAGTDRHVSARFELRHAFRRQPIELGGPAGDLLLDEPDFRVRFAVLDHATPCLAFALEERRHINIFKAEVERAGFPIGPWLRDLKNAVLSDAPDEAPFRVWWRDGGVDHERDVPLGELKRRLLAIVPGQRIAYVVDAAYSESNARKIESLARDADILFIEARFLDHDADTAARKKHLTARQAGILARRAGAKRLEPFHFSPRYAARGHELSTEARSAFAGPATVPLESAAP
jgi:ribonuclease Z